MFNYKLLNYKQLSIYQIYQRYRNPGWRNEIFMFATGLFTAMQTTVAFVSGMQKSYADACLDIPPGGENKVVLPAT